MKIAAVSAKSVEPAQTPVSRADLRNAIATAYKTVTGKAASANVLDTLTAHASLETGSGGSMYNFNFGGIKGTSPTGETAKTRTKEVIDGKEVEIRDGFRAYHSLADGALDYVKLMKGRFGGAVSKAESGDLDGFAHALKQANYYTADETKYASALHSLSGISNEGTLTRHGSVGSLSNVNMLASSTDGSGSSGAGGGFADTVELSRVLDAIAKHPTTVKDAEDEDA